MEEKDLLEKEEMHDKIETELSSAFGSGAVSFAQLEEVSKAREFYDDVRALTMIAGILLDNISWRFTPDADNKENIRLIKAALSDYTERLDALTSEVQTKEQETIVEKTRGFIAKMLGVLTKEDGLEKEQDFKTEGGKKYYASDFLYVPDKSKPSTWKLRISDGGTGKVTVEQLGRAAAALSSGGFRGNQVELPSGEMSKMKSKLKSKYRSLGVKEEDMPESLRKDNEGSFTILKQADGSYRFICIPTNNFQDVAEDILSKESHIKFIDALEKGVADYPELWHWHTKGTKWGQTDMMAFDESTGMMIASGVVLKGHEAEAEALASVPFAVGVSHGMPKASVRRDPSDPRIITDYITKEISDLPLVNAANRLTHFLIHKEEVMPIPEAKKNYLKSVGVPDEVIEDIETTMQKSFDEANKDGIVSKEVEGAKDETPTPDTTKTEDTVPPVGEEIPEADPAKVEAKEKDSEPLTKEDIAKAVAEGFQPIIQKLEASISELQGKVETLTKEAAAKKDEEALAKEKMELTPPSSLAALISRQVMASTSGETLLRKNAALAKEAPEETAPIVDSSAVATGNPLLNSVITKIIGGDKSAPTKQEAA